MDSEVNACLTLIIRLCNKVEGTQRWCNSLKQRRNVEQVNREKVHALGGGGSRRCFEDIHIAGEA